MTSVNKQTLVSRINTQLRDNSKQEISPRDVRTNLLDIIDSVYLFTADQNLNALNFSTPDTRTTRAGVEALGKLKLAGYSSQDNSAFGYSALNGNYDGIQNTAVGSYAMSCNLYGSGNVGVGYNALAGNVFGSRNVAIGNHAIQSNKHGSYNIAIGHGAGHYIGENDSYKLYVASHDVNDTILCDVPAGASAAPLIFGDLQNIKLGVGVKSFHDHGMLQVAGGVASSGDDLFNLGHGSYRWKNAYLSTSINDKIYFNDSAALRVKGDIVPDITNIYSIGDSGRGLLWDGYFNDLTVSGVANVNNLIWNTITDCTYDCRTLYLASSGLCDGTSNPPCGYLSDTQVEGGGLVLQASGTDYKRDYHWTFLAPDYSQTCLSPNLFGSQSAMAHASWYSNISVKIESGRHVKTDRVIGRDTLSLLNNNKCYGWFLRASGDDSNNSYLTEERLITPNPLDSNGQLGNIADVNFLSSGTDFTASHSSVSSGVSVGHKLIARTSTTKEADRSDEKSIGFDLRYMDEKDVIEVGQFGATTLGGSPTNQEFDRFLLSSYNNSVTPLNAVTVMRNEEVGLVGITSMSGSILPETIFNIQSTGIPENRTAGAGGAKLQLLSENNKLQHGTEIFYSADTRRVDVSMFRNWDKQLAVSITNNCNNVGIGTTVAPERLTVASGCDNNASIAFWESSGTVSATDNHGKLYVKELIDDNQCQTIYFLDDCGNEFNLVGNKYASSGDRVYSDNYCNTHVGWDSPNNRKDIKARGQTGNTSVGGKALYNLNGGDNNIAIGCGAGSGITSGSLNIIIGNPIGETTVNKGHYNILVGHLLEDIAGDDSYNFIMGANALTGAVGTTAYMTGVMGPNSADRILQLPKGKLRITSQDEFEHVTFATSGIDNTDLVNEFPTESFDFTFTSPVGGEGGTLKEYNLLSLKHHKAPIDTTCCTFSTPSPEVPYAQLDGDLRLAGALRFCDGTSLNTVGDLVVEAGSGIRITQGAGSNTKIHLGIDKLSENTSANAMDFYLAVASGQDHTRMNFSDLAGYINPLAARIDNCVDGQAGYRYLFTNNSTIGDSGCNTVYMGNEVGHLSNGWNHSVMIGTHAGRNAQIAYSTESEHATLFIGHQAGEDTVGCHSATFIGPNAGWNADNSYRSTFIGDEAGQNASSNRSVGIGDNALENVSGTCNLEITTGIGKDGVAPWETRIMNGSISNKMNIGDCFAGDMSQRRLSVGNATLSPTAVFSVKKESVAGHNETDWVQDAYCDGTQVAGTQCDGVPFAAFTKDAGANVGRIYIEGIAQAEIPKPTANDSPTEGQIMIKKQDGWADDKLVTITNRDISLLVPNGALVIAILINGEYRPIWVSC
tara:strand:+ start:14290 stop:18336 length:4047 start_codon:yes stop_codon:yes gene_type:complete